MDLMLLTVIVAIVGGIVTAVLTELEAVFPVLAGILRSHTGWKK